MRSSRPTRFLPSLIAGTLIFLSGTHTQANTLFGGVSHADFLEPPSDAIQTPAPPPALVPQQAISLPIAVSPTVGLGSAKATLDHPVIEWFPIPKWLAGKWSKNGDTTTSVTDLRTGQEVPVNEYIEDHMTVFWGYQTDNRGNIWHANLIPSAREGMSQGKNVQFMIVNLRVIEATPANLATRTHYVVRETLGRELADIFQQEALTHYQLAGSPYKMDAISSNRVFSYQGRPKRDGKMVSHYTKDNEFQTIPSKDGIDLAASLNDYLRRNNMAALAKGPAPAGFQPAAGATFQSNSGAQPMPELQPPPGFLSAPGMQAAPQTQSTPGFQPSGYQPSAGYQPDPMTAPRPQQLLPDNNAPF
ncbi:MAG TPA: hypothetical protein V6C76_07150 [Drouetiella sp.]